MAQIMEEIKQLFDKARAGAPQEQAAFTLQRQGGATFEKRRQYMQVLVNDMFLAHERQWWVRYAPVALVATTYLYAGEYQTVPIVVGPSLFKEFSQEEAGAGTIIRNAPVTTLHPYAGGAVTLTVIFSKVEKGDNSEKVLDVLESFSNLASPLAPVLPFSSYLKIAGNVISGARVLLNLPQTRPLMRYRETINPQINQTLQPVYLVLIDSAGLGEEEKARFFVQDSRLHYDDPDSGPGPYRKNDFIMLEIAQGTRRTDEETLAFYPLWEQTRRLGLQSAQLAGLWPEAKNAFNALKVAIIESPDLTKEDSDRLIESYFAELKKIRLEGPRVEDLKAGEERENELQTFQKYADQLDELDQL